MGSAGHNPLSRGSLVLDPQGVQQVGVNLSGDRQPLLLLECSNRFTAVGANFSVYHAVVITALSKFRLHRERQVRPILRVVNRSVAGIGIIVGVRGVGGVPPRKANREANGEAERNEIKNEDEIVVVMEEEMVVELIINELIINEPIINEPMVVKETVVINQTMVIKETAAVTKPLSRRSMRPASCRNSHTVMRSASCETSHPVPETSHAVPRYG